MGFLSFKLTLVVLALRVCKPEGGRRVVTCLGDNGVRWPKAFSGGLENTKLIGGLVKAQPEARISSLSEDISVKPMSFKGLLVKPMSFKGLPVG